jgi:formate/nitrite transporter FocA (FNT family)
MKGAFEDDFMGSDTIHAIVNAIAFFLQIAFDLQSGKFVGHHSDPPTWSICLGVWFPERINFVGGFIFVTLAKRAVPPRC